MSTPALFVGAAGDLLRTESGYLDGNATYEFRGRTNAIAPAGAGGECAFPVVYLTLTFGGLFQLVVTPIVDHVPQWDLSVAVQNSNVLTERVTQTFELAFSIPHIRGGVVKGRHYLRGAFFALEFGLPCTPSAEADLAVESAEVEFDVLSQSGGAG